MKKRTLLKLAAAAALLFSAFSLQEFKGAATERNTAIFGYSALSGSWTKNSDGSLSGSAAKQPALLLSDSETSGYLEYEATVKLEKKSAASLVLRANETGTEGYKVSLDAKKETVSLGTLNQGRALRTVPLKLKHSAAINVKTVADGPCITVSVNGRTVLEVTDYRFSKGYAGFQAENGNILFSKVKLHEIRTNLTGLSMKKGKWQAGPDGLEALPGQGEDLSSVSSVSSKDFTFESDLLIKDKHAAASLLIRSDKTGTKAYQVKADAEKNRLQLIDVQKKKILEEKQVTIDHGTLYHVKVKAEGSSLQVFWQNAGKPVIDAEDDSYSNGFLGFHAGGHAVFQNSHLSDLQSNLEGWQPVNGEWAPHLEGVGGTSPPEENAFRIAETEGDDFVLEADLKIDSQTPFGTAGLIFRGKPDASEGYMLTLDPNLNQIRLLDLKGDRTLGIADRDLEPGKLYHVEVHAAGDHLKIYFDGYADPTISVTDSAYSSGKYGLNVYNGTAFFQHVYGEQHDTYYSELYRPQYHFTQARGYASDPNGLVYYEGEYHLFHQDGGKWAHAVSTDLVHWKRLPIAIPWNEMGHAWSGSAVVDKTNASGLFDKEGSGLIAFYTSFNPEKHNGDQKVGVAYSQDKGRTWEFYDGNPIIPNIGEFYGGEGWDFRDPKVVWDGEHNQWVMVISGGDHIRFFTSQNLLAWEMIELFGYGDYVRGGVWECPDFFQLPVDGDPSKKKWVLSISTGANPKTGGSDSEYFTGTFDGNRFESDNPAGKVLKNEFGKEMYAAMSFADIPEEDGRRISLGWMSNWDYPFAFPTSPWRGQMSIPRELTLKTVPGEGVRLFQKPVEELEQLRGAGFSWSDKTVKPGDANLLADIKATSYEIKAEIELPENSKAEFGFGLRESGSQNTVAGYKASEGIMFFDRSQSGDVSFSDKFSTYHETSAEPENKRVKVNIFVDESSVEVFGNDGAAVFSNVIFPDGASDGMSFYTKGGSVKIVSLDVYPLKGIWKEGEGSAEVVMDHQKMTLPVGGVHKLSASVTGKHQKLKWHSSNPDAAKIEKTDDDSAEIRMTGHGRSIITASAANGKIAGRTIIESTASFKIAEKTSGKFLVPEGKGNGSKTRLQPGGEHVWKIENAAPGAYKVHAGDSKFVLDASGVTAGDDVQIWEYFGYGNQQWKITDQWDGTYRFSAVNSGKVMGVKNNRPEDGTIAEIQNAGGGEFQDWELINFEGNGIK
ncbi:GH32 C-terminal domain-containing protein [Metabacillus sp. cB07]|uniref:GH32 C-terminal domain-containing protein n=1 Tax=Metabacillus sp. cB07 TaxID=2806989 RepID=UPI00193A4947|nr:GH32 C-terminal domain-containing protein [Metabacillus sp. cB07]